MGTVPTGMLHISMSLALMGTSQGCFYLDGKWDSSPGGENVSVSPWYIDSQGLPMENLCWSIDQTLIYWSNIDLLAAFLEERFVGEEKLE